MKGKSISRLENLYHFIVLSLLFSLSNGVHRHTSRRGKESHHFALSDNFEEELFPYREFKGSARFNQRSPMGVGKCKKFKSDNEY